MRKLASSAIVLTCLGLACGGVMAQSLTPEQIKAMIDQRMNTLNPYQELISDPDPARSLAAMQIMLESGDKHLRRMALEYGLLSPDPAVKRAAFESYLATGPIFSIRFDGSRVKSDRFQTAVTEYWHGHMTPDRVGYWRIQVGEYHPEPNCFANTDAGDRCFVTVNSDGIFLTVQSSSGAGTLNARGTIGDDGVLSGFATFLRWNVDEPTPFSIKLLD